MFDIITDIENTLPAALASEAGVTIETAREALDRVGLGSDLPDRDEDEASRLAAFEATGRVPRIPGFDRFYDVPMVGEPRKWAPLD